MSTAEYDQENIFAQIIDGKAEAFKVWESKASLAFLDAFPMVEGHTILVPKLKGFATFAEMPAPKASEFLRDLQKVVQAVKEATGASAVNVWSNDGPDAGQTVNHPHFHIVPRKAGDKLPVSYPASAKEKLTKEAAEPLLAKFEESLNPPKPLKKAKWNRISDVKPDSRGMNLKLKVLQAPTEVESKGGKFWEAIAGDDSGTVTLSLRDNQKDVATEGAILAIRNGGVKMVQGHIRVAVDKWGKIEVSDEDMPEEVDQTPEKNISVTEYVLVPH